MIDATTLIQHGMSATEAERAMRERNEREDAAEREGIAVYRHRIARSSVSKLNHRTEASFWPV